MSAGFAVWLTGRPASGKSTLARALASRLTEAGLDPEVLESDALRRAIAPRAGYGDADRDEFYGALIHVASLLARHGVPVVIDATGSRRAYREEARRRIARFAEVHVDCPPDVCAARDPKGIYRRARAGEAAGVPGLDAPYEEPERPDLTVRGDGDDPEEAAGAVVALLRARGFLEPEGDGG
ncbi:MAG: adenylyl-sulfate kinase [Hyphomicrobiales bacterium]